MTRDARLDSPKRVYASSLFRDKRTVDALAIPAPRGNRKSRRQVDDYLLRDATMIVPNSPINSTPMEGSGIATKAILFPPWAKSTK